MPSCERCWEWACIDAASKRVPVSECYRERLERNHCEPEQQAGSDATECARCNRRTVHQHAHVCMACGATPAPATGGDDE